MEERKSKNVVIIALCLTLIFMGVGFAALSQNLTINATGTITSSWDVHFDSVEDDTAALTANTANEGVSTSATGAGTTVANVAFTLAKPGDQVQYKFVAKNYGTIKAGLATATAALDEETYVSRTITVDGADLTMGADDVVLTPANLVLNQNDTAEVIVTYTFNDVDALPAFTVDTDDDGKMDAYQVNDTIVLGFVQK